MLSQQVRLYELSWAPLVAFVLQPYCCVQQQYIPDGGVQQYSYIPSTHVPGTGRYVLLHAVAFGFHHAPPPPCFSLTHNTRRYVPLM